MKSLTFSIILEILNRSVFQCSIILEILDIWVPTILDNPVRGGTYVVMEGPQFSTFAESNLYRSWGADVIGMTNMPEAKLAREAEMRYCTVAMVTDYDCWHPDHEEVDVSIVLQTLMKNAANAQNMIKEVIKTFKDFSIDKDPANNCLDVAIITDPKLRSKKTKKKLVHIAGRVLKK